MKYPIHSQQRAYLRDGRAPIPYNENISKVMSANKGKNTSPELRLRRELWNQGLKGYRLQWKKVPGKPDIAFPGKKIAIFVNGCFWHRCPICSPSSPKTNVEFWKIKFEKNIERDRRKQVELEEIGWTVIVIWECQLKADIKSCVEKIRLEISN
jgi:DNA mismatch endonuclease (patch repair protein)